MLKAKYRQASFPWQVLFPWQVFILWNTSVTEYKDKNKKKQEYNELLELLKDVCPSVNLAALKGIILSLLCEFMREMQRKLDVRTIVCKYAKTM
jgi:hypothetical protein